MLAEHKIKLLQSLVADASKEELAWMHGYIAGVISPVVTKDSTPAVAAPAVNKVTIAYGTETGNSKRVATEFAAKAKKAGINAKVVSLDQYRLNDLPKEEYFLTIISTQGEGEPPEAAKKFYDHIHHNGFTLNKLKYSVLALGDTAYPLFCKAGEDVDEQLQKLGGSRIADIQRCDVDYDEDANQWFSTVLRKLAENKQAASDTATVAPAGKKAGGKKAYTGTVLSNINLNDRGSNKMTWHIELAADAVEYECGDSIGIVPENAQGVVEKILSRSKGADAAKKIAYKNETLSISELLTSRLNISHLIAAVIKRYASITGHNVSDTKMDLADLLKLYPVNDAAQFEEVLGILNPVAPRLYTMASSPAAHNGEVHVIIARDTFTANGEVKLGVCSDFLGMQQAGASLPFFVQKNKRFRLPAPEKDIIMIGPGTGIAPYRSFLAERDAVGATGRNWLFFGEQHFASDFLYQTELQNWFETGVLTKINVAFSRDQPEKIYVQHRMLEHGAELYKWIQQGAHVFLCGKKDPMSIDVEHALVSIIEKHGEKTTEEAKEYFLQLESEGRYSEDVY